MRAEDVMKGSLRRVFRGDEALEIVTHDTSSRINL